MNPAWQDLAEGWGEPTELQIPRFARDDNSKGEGKNVAAAVPYQSKAKTA